jgi:hypothetical protein
MAGVVLDLSRCVFTNDVGEVARMQANWCSFNI